VTHEVLDEPWWVRWALVGLGVMLLFLLCRCGSAGDDLFSTPVSPVTDGGLSEDSLAGSDDAHDPGLDAAVTGETGADEQAMWPVDGPPEGASALDASPPRDVLGDPWPADVVVETAFPPNCFVTQRGDDACCFARNEPPLDCEAQRMPHHCSNCPP